ncbi:hypothetical protein MCOR25_009629 [Pyricularia grisea]|nr:hypothetical protein MCOR25_009629 [Pyricularia grisea]
MIASNSRPWADALPGLRHLDIATGIVFYILMPYGPNDPLLLNEREKVLRARMFRDREGGDKASFSVGQLKEALQVLKVWRVFWFGVLTTMQAPVLTFASLVIEYVGYNDTKRYTWLLWVPCKSRFSGVGVLVCWLIPQK